MMVAIILFIWISYSLLEGFREGYYFFNRVNNPTPDKLEIHPYFFVQRFLFAFIVSLIVLNYGHWVSAMLFFFGSGLIFPFFHDGMYYLTRNNLDHRIYTKRWKDNSDTSTAYFEFDYTERVLLLIIGGGAYLTVFYLISV